MKKILLLVLFLIPFSSCKMLKGKLSGTISGKIEVHNDDGSVAFMCGYCGVSVIDMEGNIIRYTASNDRGLYSFDPADPNAKGKHKFPWQKYKLGVKPHSMGMQGGQVDFMYEMEIDLKKGAAVVTIEVPKSAYDAARAR